MNTPVSLSVVIIARNEEENIARAIESVLYGVRKWVPAQILLVDSASTDKTVEIASNYPIDIVRLKASWFLSASAGRYIGMHNTWGDLLLYMDGDMELVDGWLDKAIPFISHHPESAGIAGYRQDIDLQNEYTEKQNQVHDKEPVEVKHFGGAALYRRSALEKIGGFNPYLISEEEPELCMRLRYSGYKLIRIPYLMCRNYTLPVKSWKYFLQRFRTNLWLGHGQVPRYHLKTGMLWMNILERGTYMVYLIGMFISILGLGVSVFFKDILFLAVWVLIVVTFFITYAVKKRSLRNAWLSVVHQSFVAYGALRGFLMAPKPPAEYPLDVEIIQLRGVMFDAK